MGSSNLQYFAKGCFLAGTVISTPLGDRAIENLRRGDRVVSFNEKTQKQEISEIKEIDILKRDSYFNINNMVKATADHPFYTSDGIKKVSELKIGDELVGKRGDFIPVETLEVIQEEVVVYNLLDVTPNNNYYANNFLVHNKGCFLPDTRIVTPEGTKKIKDIRPNDTVVSLNESNKNLEYSRVQSVQMYEVEGYYVINDTLKVTAEHPVYVAQTADAWFDDGEFMIVEVQDIQIGDHLILGESHVQEIRKIEYFDKTVTVYNLINVTPNHNYFAGSKLNQYLVHNKGGGGCFLAGTKITMVSGPKNIEDVKAGDQVWSFDEKTRVTAKSEVTNLETFTMPGYYIINGEVKTTEGHPFYTTNGIKKVVDLEVGDVLIKNFDVKTPIRTIEYVEEEVTVYNLFDVTPNHNYLADGYLVHNKGFSGGRSSSSGGFSSSKSTSSSTGAKGSSSSSSSYYNSSSSRSTTSSSTKPGSKITTNDGKSVQTSSKKPTSSNVNQQAGITGVDGYTPRFTNGYSAPAGSVVYYPQHDLFDYLPWIYLFSDHSPANDAATIVQPDGKEVTAQPVQDGADGLAFFNWIVLIIIGIAIIGGIVWLVNRLTNKGSY